MKNIFFKFGIVGIIMAFPAVIFAQTNPTLLSLSQSAVSYFNMAIEVILGLAVVVFVFNIYRYFFMERESKERGMYLLWSIIGFAVIVCFWGLVNLLTNTFNLNNSAPTSFGNLFGGSSGTPTGNNGNPFGSSIPSSNPYGSNSGSGLFSSPVYGNNPYGSAGNISNPFGSYSPGNYSSGGGVSGVNSSFGASFSIGGPSQYGGSTMCGGLQMPPNGNGITYSCQNGQIVSGSAGNPSVYQYGGSTMCGGLQMPPNGNGITYSCQNGQIVSGSASASNSSGNSSSAASDYQACINLGMTADDCSSELNYYPSGNSSTGSAGNPTQSSAPKNNSNPASNCDALGNCIDDYSD